MKFKQKSLIKFIQAAAGRGKTDYIIKFIRSRIESERFIVATRSRKTATTFMKQLMEILDERAEDKVRTIVTLEKDGDESIEQLESVAARLDVAFKDESIRILIICHKALDSYPRWDEVKDQFILFIDELFETLVFNKSQKPLPESICKILNLNPDNYRSIPLEALRDAGEEVYTQNKSADTLSPSLLALVESIRDAEVASIRLEKGKFKIVVLRETRIFRNLVNFKEVFLAAMWLEGTLPHLIGKARGFEFVPSDWERQGEGFNADHLVTIIPIMHNDASASRFDALTKGKPNFERMVDHTLKVLAKLGPQIQDNEESKPIMFMINNEGGRKDVIKSHPLGHLADFMRPTTHGEHEWMEYRKFALLFTARWNRDYTQVATEYASKLGVTAKDIENAFEVSSMLEPILQAATRGQVRKRENNKSMWIVTADERSALFLRDTLLKRAKIDYSKMLELDACEGSTTKRGGIAAAMKNEYGLNDTQKKFVYRRCKDLKLIDRSNPEHVLKARELVEAKYPHLVVNVQRSRERVLS